MDLNALREFAAVIEQGSFAAAARALGVPKSTVSKRIQDLERDLGVLLIERTTRRLHLTPDGAMVLARAERILADAADIRHSLSRGEGAITGHLRISAPQIFGQIFLGPIATACRSRHPGLTLEIQLSEGQPDLDEEGFDAAIRTGAVNPPMVARPLMQSRRILVAAPGALQGSPATPQAVGEHPVALCGHGLIQTWHLAQGREETAIRVAGGLTFSTYASLREAVLAGAGLALMPDYVVSADLAEGRLVRHLPGWSGPEVVFSLVYASPQALTQRLRAFIDILGEVFPGGA